jgi:DNA-binding NtrC family response regulator
MTTPAFRGRILFADDEPDVRSAISRLLQIQGFTCTCVASGEEVLEQLRREEFDALISDIRMPGNDGLSLIESIPQIVAGLPVVLLTGAPTVETAARSLRLPVVAYLTKPADFNELVRILDEAILQHRAFRAMRAEQRHLKDWENELESILRQHRSAAMQADGSMLHYLELTIRHIILILAELEQATRAIEHSSPKVQTSQLFDREIALRRTVDVLRRTKQSFKSKELAELRMELERLLDPKKPTEEPAGN